MSNKTRVVRHACEDDLDKIVELARAEYEQSWLSGAGGEPFEADGVRSAAEGFIRHASKIAMVTCDPDNRADIGGYLAAIAQPTGFNASRWAVEFAWYSRDGGGLIMLAAFERWARDMRCTRMVLHDMAGGRLGQYLHDYRGWQLRGYALDKAVSAKGE